MIERDDLLQDSAGAPILVSTGNRDRWIGAAFVPAKGADEHAVAELKNDVLCSGFTEVLVRSDNERAILALKESAVTALELAGVNVKMEESAQHKCRNMFWWSPENGPVKGASQHGATCARCTCKDALHHAGSSDRGDLDEDDAQC